MNIKKIQARLDAATPFSEDRWWYGTETEGHPAPTQEMIDNGTDSCTWVDKICLGGWFSKFPGGLSPEVAEFLVNAPKDIAFLLARVDDLERSVRAWQEKPRP